MQNDNIANTLIEVRKAYRFLYEYQKRILDLINFIGNHYKLNYRGGYPKHSNPAPNNGRGRLDNWAWDWLNMYYYEFNFKHREIDGNNFYFAIFLVNDTGFYKANPSKDRAHIKKIDISTYAKIEDSETKLIFVAGKNKWGAWGYLWDEDSFLLESQGEIVESENEYTFFKSYNLERFVNEESTMECINDFRKHAKNKGYLLSDVDDIKLQD